MVSGRGEESEERLGWVEAGWGGAGPRERSEGKERKVTPLAQSAQQTAHWRWLSVSGRH